MPREMGLFGVVTVRSALCAPLSTPTRRALIVAVPAETPFTLPLLPLLIRPTALLLLHHVASGGRFAATVATGVAPVLPPAANIRPSSTANANWPFSGNGDPGVSVAQEFTAGL